MGVISEIFADVANKGMPTMSVDAMKTLPGGILPMLGSTDMIVTADDLAKMAEELKNNPPPTDLPAVTSEEQATIGQLEQFFSDVLNGDATAHVFENIDGDRDICAVSADNPDEVRILGGRPLEIIPGNNMDWNALTYLHENAHCEDFKDGGYSKSGINVELYADSKGVQDYYNAYRNGVVSNPEVPYAWRAQRAIDVMEQGTYGENGPQNHSVNAIIPLPGEKYAGAQHASNHAAGEAMLEARQQIMDEIGGGITELSDMQKLQTMQGLAYADPSIDPALKQKIFAANAEAIFDPKGNFESSVERIEAQLPQEFLTLYNERVALWEKAEQRNAAEFAIEEQPGLMYETSKRMLQAGEFNDNPAGKKFVEVYVDGVERYDPTRHGVAQEYIPTGRPEIVDQLAQQYAPRPEVTPGFGMAR